MNKDRKIKNTLYLLIAIGLLAYMGISIYHSIVEGSKNPIEILKSPPDDYVNLFNKTTLPKLFLKNAVQFKLRNPMLYINYDKKYNLEVTKINIKKQFNPGIDIIEQYKKGDGVFPDSKVHYDEGGVVTNYNGISTETASRIYLSLYGDSAKAIIKNDSTAFYYLKLKNVFVQYRPNGMHEIYLEPTSKLYFFSSEPSVSLLFLKRKGSLYFLLLTANDDNEKLDPNLLYKLVSKE